MWQRQNSSMKKIFLLIVFAFVFLFTGIPVSYGQVSQQSLIVYPAVVELEVKPGESTRFLIQFRNNGQIPVAGTIKTVDFTVKDKEGTPILLEGSDDKPPYAASYWIKANVDQITIPANDFVAVYFTAQVPNIVKTCGNYALVYFENEASSPLGSSKKTTSSSAVTTKIGSLVNFTVKNETCREGLILNNLKVPFFSEYGPVKATFELINKGDYHVAPIGTAYITNIFNIKTDEQKLADKRIFPGTLKEHEISLGKKWMIGRYQLVINGKYGLHNLPVTAVAYFWVFPWRITIIIILAIILLVLFGKKTIYKEKELEQEVKEEKEEIERLKEQLKKRQ